MVLSRSIDGFTASTPLEALQDDRNAIFAIGMNGEPLPLEHGYPVRMVVPGLYGYVSATKWVVELEVTRFGRRDRVLDRPRLDREGPDQALLADRRAARRDDLERGGRRGGCRVVTARRYRPGRGEGG